MNFLMSSKKLKTIFLKILRLRLIVWLTIKEPVKKPRPKISLLFPFSTNDPVRKATFRWLLKYWAHELPDAEIIIGRSGGKPFCKGKALNNAARKATGKVLVIIDADTYMPGSVINYCADRILEDLNDHLWFVPYRHLYRLNKKITEKILASDPTDPLRIPSPPPPDYIDGDKFNNKYGHRYGAMVMIFPREALDVLGCFDERFKGWGGEDIALLRALDTLYGKHKTTKNDVLHLWHPFIGDKLTTRVWPGQDEPQPNKRLAMAYHRASRHPTKMRELVDAGCSHHHKHPRS